LPEGPSKVHEHYEALLAEHYTWMFGTSFREKVAEQCALLNELGVECSSEGARAVDLGCGSGFQAVALGELGYEVLAIDSSAKLLAELALRRDGYAIRTAQADLRNFVSLAGDEAVDVVVCMGDTLTDLESRKHVSQLFTNVAGALAMGGLFILTYRDYAESELSGLDRLFVVQSDYEKVMTRLLEYENADFVVVHDLLKVRDHAGRWTLREGSYRKLRLSSHWIEIELKRAGFAIRTARLGEMMVIKAEKY